MEIEGSEQSENIRVEGLAWVSLRVGCTGKQAYPAYGPMPDIYKGCGGHQASDVYLLSSKAGMASLGRSRHN